MSVFSGLNKLKDALDDAIHDDQKNTPAGHSKTQSEVRAEIHGEERKEHEIQKKSGWSDKVSPPPIRSTVGRWSMIGDQKYS